jgi:hypothetical protein
VLAVPLGGFGGGKGKHGGPGFGGPFGGGKKGNKDITHYH